MRELLLPSVVDWWMGGLMRIARIGKSVIYLQSDWFERETDKNIVRMTN